MFFRFSWILNDIDIWIICWYMIDWYIIFYFLNQRLGHLNPMAQERTSLRTCCLDFVERNGKHMEPLSIWNCYVPWIVFLGKIRKFHGVSAQIMGFSGVSFPVTPIHRYVSEELKHRETASRIVIAMQIIWEIGRPTLDHAELATAAPLMFGVALQPIKDESTKTYGKILFTLYHESYIIIYPVISGNPMTWRRSMARLFSHTLDHSTTGIRRESFATPTNLRMWCKRNI